MIGRYFRYELKKNLKTLGLLTAICTIIYVVVTSTSNLFFYIYSGDVYVPGQSNSGGIRNNSPQISIIYLLLGAMCFVVPALMYSFKMNRRSADAFYSLPIKREKLYLVKTLVGLILVFVPYTVAYAAGFLCVALRENYYDLIWYLPGYFGGILFGLSLYGVAAFSFARANRVADGVIFMIFYALIGLLIGIVVLIFLVLKTKVQAFLALIICTVIVGVVGVLQFDVLKYRLENEYNVDIRLENLPYEHIRWIENWEEIDLAKLVGTSDMKKVRDLKGNPLLLFVNSWSVGMVLERNPGLVLSEFGKN